MWRLLNAMMESGAPLIDKARADKLIPQDAALYEGWTFHWETKTFTTGRKEMLLPSEFIENGKAPAKTKAKKGPEG